MHVVLSFTHFRYNLINAFRLSVVPSNIIAVLVPFGLALFFYAGNQLSELINWSSVRANLALCRAIVQALSSQALLFVELNIMIPAYLFIRQVRRSNVLAIQAGLTSIMLAAHG
jgi:hypothetical protein